MLEKILFGLFSIDIQVKHHLKVAKITILEMSLYQKSLSMQKLLPIKKGDIFFVGN